MVLPYRANDIPNWCSMPGDIWPYIGIAGSTLSGFRKKKIRITPCSCTMSDSEGDENSIQMPQSHKFIEQQLEILQYHVATVKAAETKKDQHKIIKTAWKEVLALSTSRALPAEARQDLIVAINSWSAVWSRRTRDRIKFGKTWTGRLVMYHEKKEMVNRLKAKLFEEAKDKGNEPATAFNFFQKAMSEIWEELTRDEQKHFRQVAIQWNRDGVSQQQKQESVFF